MVEFFVVAGTSFSSLTKAFSLRYNSFVKGKQVASDGLRHEKNPIFVIA